MEELEKILKNNEEDSFKKNLQIMRNKLTYYIANFSSIEIESQ